MRAVLAALVCASLVGCASNPFVRTEVVIQKEYVVRKATDQQKMLPPYPQPIDIATATQSMLAQWIVDTEGRQYELESIINRLVQFYEAPVGAPAAAASAASAPTKAESKPEPKPAAKNVDRPIVVPEIKAEAAPAPKPIIRRTR